MKSRADLEASNAELEQRVKERTRSLKEIQDRLVRQEKLATIGRLAASISHELRNPLGVISNSAYFLLKQHHGVEGKIAKHLGIIQESVKQATGIISDLLSNARVKPDEPKDINVQNVVDHVLSTIVVVPGNIKVSTRYDHGLPLLLLDERKLTQVVVNIVTNAFQAMPSGGTLTISTMYKDDNVIMAFTDTGMGIPPEHQDRLFEPLFSTKTRGIGLGLVVVKEIVEGYGGKVEVISHVGMGTTFTIILPPSKK